MTPAHLLVTRDGSVLQIVLNRPATLNALNAQLIDELDGVLVGAESDPAVGAVVLSGAGTRAFSVGADLREIVEDTPSQAEARSRRVHAMFARIEQLRMPVIAAVGGLALGGGCELALACTLRLAADDARFGQPEISLGLIPGYGATVRLPRLIGRGAAYEMLLSGEPISAADAYRVGLVNRVVRSADLMTTAIALAHTLAAKPRVAMRYLIDAVSSGCETSAAAAREREAVLFGLVCATEDMREGTKAFLEKRRPEFSGR